MHQNSAAPPGDPPNPPPPPPPPPPAVVWSPPSTNVEASFVPPAPPPTPPLSGPASPGPPTLPPPAARCSSKMRFRYRPCSSRRSCGDENEPAREERRHGQRAFGVLHSSRRRKYCRRAQRARRCRALRGATQLQGTTATQPNAQCTTRLELPLRLQAVVELPLHRHLHAQGVLDARRQDPLPEAHPRAAAEAHAEPSGVGRARLAALRGTHAVGRRAEHRLDVEEAVVEDVACALLRAGEGRVEAAETWGREGGGECEMR